MSKYSQEISDACDVGRQVSWVAAVGGWALQCLVWVKSGLALPALGLGQPVLWFCVADGLFLLEGRLLNQE